MSLAVALLLSLGGCGCFYLSSPHQPWRAKALPPWPARALGALLLVGSYVAFGRSMAPLPAVFTLLTAVMLQLVALPYVAAMRLARPPRAARRPR